MKCLSITAAIIGALAISASGQDLDEPGPGVARLSLVEGDITIRRGDSGEFVAAEPNAPVVALDHVITGDDGRVEIQFDWANMLRLAPNSEVRLAALEEGDFFLQLVEGLATHTVLRESDALVEISTLTASIRPLEQGTYRVLASADGSTEITVRSGEAEIFTARGSEFLRAGRTMQLQGNPDDPTVVVVASIPLDEWDSWNEARNRDLSRSESYRYVSRDVYGADDLDGHGRWVYDSPYGWVWVPRVSRSWAPYRVGRWSWVNHYGWTWISGDPWGWAPYHYGRWYYAPSYGWAWYPGSLRVRHVWRPALVTFFGWGSARFNVSIGFGFGNVGWVPLAPYEIYRPWYGRRNRTNITVNNVTVINNVDINRFRNARFVGGRNAVTSVRTQNFGRNRVTVNNFVQASDNELRRAGEVRGRMPLAPSRQGRQFSDRTVDARNIRQRTIDDTRLARRGSAAGATNNRALARREATAISALPATDSDSGVRNRNNAPARANAASERRIQRQGAGQAARNPGQATNNRAQQRRAVEAPTAISPAAPAASTSNPGNRVGTGNSAALERRTQAQGATATTRNPGQTNNNRAQQRRAVEAPTATSPARSANNAPARTNAPSGRRIEQSRPAPQPQQSTAPVAERRNPAPAPQVQTAPDVRRAPAPARARAQDNARSSGQATNNRAQQRRAVEAPAAGRRDSGPPPQTRSAPEARQAPEPRSQPQASRSAPQPSRGGNNRGQARAESRPAPSPPAASSPSRGNGGQNGRARNDAGNESGNRGRGRP